MENKINLKYKKREKIVRKTKKKHDKRIALIVILSVIMCVLTISYYNPNAWTQIVSKFSKESS